jgi:hypothetical protein
LQSDKILIIITNSENAEKREPMSSVYLTCPVPNPNISASESNAFKPHPSMTKSEYLKHLRVSIRVASNIDRIKTV